MRITLWILLASGAIADGASKLLTHSHFTVYRDLVTLHNADSICTQNGLGRLAHLTGYDTRDKNSFGSLQLVAAIEAVQRLGILKVWIGSLGDRSAPLDNEGLPFVLDVGQDTRINDVILPGKLITVPSIYSEYPVLCQSDEAIQPTLDDNLSKNHLQTSRRFRREAVPQMNYNLPPMMPYIMPPMYISPMMTPNGIVNVAQPLPTYGMVTQPFQPIIPQNIHPFQTAQNGIPRTFPQNTNGAFQPTISNTIQTSNNPVPITNDPLNIRIQKELHLILLGHHFKSLYSKSDIDLHEEMYDFTFGKRNISPYGRRDRIVADEHAIVLPPKLRRKGLLIQHGMPLVPNVNDLAHPGL